MTIKEIAKISGVSIATVSRVINNDESFRVSEKTREKIMKNIKKYGYIKRNIGTNINRFKVGIIKLFETEIEYKNTYYSMFYLTLENRLKEEKIKYEIFFKKKLNNPKTLEELKFLDAIIIVGETSDKFLLSLLKYNTNILCLDNDIKIDSVDSISFDYKLSVKKVIDYLIKQGHSNIALITGKYDKKDFRAKYFEEITKKRKNLKRTILKVGEFKKESGYLLTKELLKNKKNIPTAIFCGNDNIASGVYNAIYESGRKIPDDISVIGFNDNKISKFLNPPLTTISINIDNIIDIGIKLLKEKIYNKRTFTCKVLVQTDLIIRKSIKKL
ncbi:LacI family DNA-binding transcriptional regulator [Oceanivirga miroungae]|uniref:Sugar-binding transcriptional regulator, LacI family n=1 Tax=Oceanivirga miroungae TaxID=1130046 RepID=A0A6I8MC89_9FUSO|nr:LacI family DNA-binding transcriptional regulator [Oceanivirga miroungae]VWL85049.1 sugar-binding transcriptional regulator, LacI family [Oceanivirga miroungae]